MRASYFLPPLDGPWRIAQVLRSPTRIRIEWLQEDSLATDWGISFVSVTEVRSREGPPDPDEALAAGLLPGLTNGAALAQIHEESDEQTLFVCEWTGDFAKSDQTLAVRLCIDGNFRIGIACRMRPRIEREAATALLEQMRAAQSCFDAPAFEPLEPARDERFGPQLEPYLRTLDEAMEHDDHARALETIDAMRPALALAPLSRFALNIHISEGWAHMRAAFAGDAQGCERAIEILRKTLDNIEPSEQPDLYRAASMWLAEAYSKRDQAGDLEHAIEAYRTATRLHDAQAHPARVAHLHLRMGVLHHYVGRQLVEQRTNTAQAAERFQLAIAELDRALQLYEVAGDTAGRAEAAVAKADVMRLLGGAGREQDAANLYGQAWSILQQDDAQETLGAERYETVLHHVQSSMRALDERQFGAPAAAPEIGKTRALATFLRPLASTRQILLQPPNDSAAVSLEVALSRALNPDVSISYIGGANHPQAGNAVFGVSQRGSEDWRVPVQISLEQSHIVILVPGFTPGMQWELRYLIDQGFLDKSLLIMIPANLGFAVRELWEKARTEAVVKGLELPPYSESGALIRLDRRGRLARRLQFDAIWEPGRLLEVLEDLMSTPEEIRRHEEDGRRRLAELEQKGLVRRVRPRGRGAQDE